MQTDGREDGAQQHTDALRKAVQPVGVLLRLSDEQRAQVGSARRS
jgi:hypothetical protein